MLTVEEALEIVLAQAHQTDTEPVPLAEAPGRVLRETIVADRDFPPFHRVSMDGIALAFAEFAGGRRVFRVAGQAPAGAPPAACTAPDTCLEVATGGMLPENTDTVVPYEQIQLVDQVATVKTEQVQPGQNVHRQGIDRPAGAALLQPGIRVGAAEMAVLATVGKTDLLVAQRPGLALVATGDELVPVSDVPLPWQIRLSNPYALKTLLEPWAAPVAVLHSADEWALLEQTIGQALAAYPLVVLTGGVSAGKRDLVPDLLRAAGVEVLFHKVLQRPGKPFLFGRTPAGGTVFALPGNPVSAFMCAARYVLPWLQRSLGMAAAADEWAVLAEPLFFKPDLTWFVPAALENRRGVLYAHPRPGRGSGDLANLSEAAAFLEIPRGRQQFDAGEVFRMYRF